MPKVTPPRLLGASPTEAVDPNTQSSNRELERFGQQVASGLTNALVVGDSLQVWLPTQFNQLQVKVPAAWTAMTPLQNGWTGAITPQYRVNTDGTVSLRGYLTGGTLNSIFFTLPAALQPLNDANFAVDSASAYGKVLVRGSSNGTNPGGCQQQANNGAALSLDGVRFEPANPIPWVPSCFPVNLPLSTTASAPSFVLVTAVETDSIGNPLANPVTLAISNADWVVGQQPGFLSIRNVPGLLPSRSYALSVAAFSGVAS